jgi:hypothetical protein
MGKKPDSKLIVGSHTAELAQRFGRMIRNLVADERYKELFPDFLLSADSKAAGRWDTSHGGEAFFIGKGGAMTGRGGNVVILDDILDEQDALSNTAMENTWEWYQSGPRQRLQPNGTIIVVQHSLENRRPVGALAQAPGRNQGGQVGDLGISCHPAFGRAALAGVLEVGRVGGGQAHDWSAEVECAVAADADGR